MWLTGLVAPRHVGSSQTRARTRVPCIGRQILNHCATREALSWILINRTLLIVWPVHVYLLPVTSASPSSQSEVTSTLKSVLIILLLSYSFTTCVYIHKKKHFLFCLFWALYKVIYSFVTLSTLLLRVTHVDKNSYLTAVMTFHFMPRPQYIYLFCWVVSSFLPFGTMVLWS